MVGGTRSCSCREEVETNTIKMVTMAMSCMCCKSFKAISFKMSSYILLLHKPLKHSGNREDGGLKKRAG